MPKLVELLSILPRRPAEFLDRLSAIAQVRIEHFSRKPPIYSPREWDPVVKELSSAAKVDLSSYLRESALQDIEAEVSNRAALLPPDAPFRRSHNGDVRLARLIYALCRVLKPKVVLETGTCYGVSSSFALQALQLNGQGTLHSIDLPPLGKSGDAFVGILIPDNLKVNWKLHRGASRRILPALLPALGSVGLFVHDSLHTYRNIRMECDAVLPYLERPGAVIVDDIQDNAAFLDWLDHSKPEFSAAVSGLQKNSSFGAAFFGN